MRAAFYKDAPPGTAYGSPPEDTLRCRRVLPWSAGCGMLVAGGFCYGRLMDVGESLVSRRIHRLLRVPPNGFSESGIEGHGAPKIAKIATLPLP